jgi:UDP-3-O-[3-hydroxymyristoyl] glucosamine N-acyltransferase
MPLASMTLGEIATLVDGEVLGDPTTTVDRISAIESATPGSITFISNKKYYGHLKTTRATAVICPRDLDQSSRPKDTSAIVADQPYLAFARLMQRWYDPGPPAGAGADPRAFVGKDVVLGEGSTVHPFAYVGDGARIGARVTIHPFVHVGEGSTIGDDCVIHASAVLYKDVHVGNRCIVHAHAVIGSDGFGYAQTFENFEFAHVKIPQVGTVVLEDDVEIGAGTTIDRAVLGETRIGKGTKIDNLVQIGHNVTTGMACMVMSQAGISGSTRLGNMVQLAGQAGLAGHVEIGDGSRIWAQAGVTNDVPPGSHMLGSPAIPIAIARRYMAVQPKLPEMRRDAADLERRVAELEAKLGVVPPRKRRS